MNFYRKFEPDIKASTINWRIFKLGDLGILKRIRVGRFNLGKTQNYIPEINRKIIFLNNLLKKKFPFATFCMWHTSILNDFMIHQPGKFYLIIETEKSTTGSVFYFLKEKKYAAYLEPKGDIFDKYISGDKEPLIIKSLVTESPLQNVNGISTVTIEKILVDVFSDDEIFAAQQGSELRTIFIAAYEKYTINENRLLRYASRRRKKQKLINFINSISKNRQQISFVADL